MRNCLASLVMLILAAPAGSAAPAQQAYVKGSNTRAFDSFGYSVAISGDIMVVGARLEDSNATRVNGNQTDNNATNSGAAYVFVRKGTTWSQQACLKASNAEAGDEFGCSVAISGDTIVIGAVGEDSSAEGVNGNQADNGYMDSGAAYIFVRRGTNWIQQAYLKSPNPRSRSASFGRSEYFGVSVSVWGDTAIVGVAGDDSSATGVNGNQADTGAPSSGAVHVYVRNGTNWTHQAYLKASNTGRGDEFGRAVAISRNTVVIGAESEGSNAIGINGSPDRTRPGASQSGAAYIFVRNGGQWRQQAYLKASNTGSGDRFGCAVAISDNTVVIGARDEKSLSFAVNGNQKDRSGVDQGAAYVFVFNGVNWVQQAYLKASNTPQAYWFGHSVAVSGDAVVIGAPHEAGGDSGINGRQDTVDAPLSGAAYLFLRTGTVWRQHAYLKASNAARNQFFGDSVGLSNGTAVIGANGESTRATGINQMQDNNDAGFSGAAYIFSGMGSGPR